MTREVAILGLATASALASGCDGSISTPADVDQRLEPDATGWVDGSTTGTTDIEGQWHAYADPVSDTNTTTLTRRRKSKIRNSY